MPAVNHRWRPPAHARGILALILFFFAGLLGSRPGAAALEVQEIASPAGITAWLVEEHSVPLVAIRFAFLGGASQDPPGKEALAGMMADLLLEGGAGDLSPRAFKEKMSRLSTNLSFSCARDGIYGELETLSQRMAPSAELLRTALVNPRFDATAIELVRAQHMSDLALAANNPEQLAVNRWYAEAFAGHPYARPVDGTPESVARITGEDLRAAHGNLLGRNVLHVVIVGDIDKGTAGNTLDAIFGALPATANVTDIARIVPRALPAPAVVEKDFPLATATFGLPAPRSDQQDFPAAQVLNHIIGSGDFDSRLMEEIRVKRGLAYSVQTKLFSDTIISVMVGGLATKNAAMGTALGVLKDVFVDMARKGPTQAQFDRAKRYLTGSYLLDFDTNAKVAGSLLTFQLDGRGPDYLTVRNKRIAAVTLADIKRVAEQVLKPERLVVVVVGKPVLGP
jgi:zinc protease